ncbi:gephyrin-like molybdotransferase receptor GlpR [Gordonia bronchialis]|uniref:divisome protein SepX/GlpR n=1 Tax=Gordonia bronchialis TaxID=2054 RepID=UPI00242F7055|nr:gephyrin-like molybdotransferase receptor GlpR [Gordonia bronchialis]
MPNSVLWVCLVAVWLFVLVPMVIKGRPQMLKSTDIARATRLLHRGGTKTATPRRRVPTRRSEDGSWSRKTKEERLKAKLADDSADVEDADEKTTPVRRATTEKVEAPVVEAADDVADADLDDADSEVLDADDADADADDADAENGDEDLTDEAEYDEDAEYEDAEYEDAEYEDEDEDDSDYEEAAYEDEDDDLDEDEYDGYSRSAHVDSDDAQDEEPEPAHARESSRSRRSSGRSSAYSVEDADRDARYRERQRVTLGLFVLTLLAVVAGVVFGLAGWVATGVTAMMLVGYLFYLRRATRTEQKIRAQRAARAARTRRQEAERRRREAETPEFASAPPPPRLRRPGGAVVLEIDDEDPVFEHLPPYQRRRVMREEPEYRRVG